MQPPVNESQIVKANWARYQYALDRGHKQYVQTAAFLEGFYLGGQYSANGELLAGGHYNQADLDYLAAGHRPAYEFNLLKSAVEAAVGYQIANRMDISFRPRSGDATREVATARSKLAMQICDQNKFHWLETEVFTDGMVEQRGYLDVRMCFDENIFGELKITVLDPRDVIPDPDGKSSSSKKWKDVQVTRWLTAEEIESLWGKKAAEKAKETTQGDPDFGTEDAMPHNSFGPDKQYDQMWESQGIVRYRVIDRQHYIRERMDVAIYPMGDVQPLNGDESSEVLADMQAKGAKITKRTVDRVRWTVTTSGKLLHDDWGPYDRLTIIGYFPYFRRGKTRGMVDVAVGPAQAIDKAVSQIVHIINSTANGGWQLEEDQLTSMTVEELKAKGASTGLVLERKKGSAPLEKIQPNQVPGGTEKILEIAMAALKEVTVPDAMRGTQTEGESGILAQARQHAAQQILAVPLDNLARFRAELADWIDYAITKYYDTERTWRITRENPVTGKEEDEAITINKFDPTTGTYLNDMTAGKYDYVITEQPMQVTFENSQFTQIMEMRKEGVMIPDAQVVRASNLTNKAEIVESMQGAQAPPPDPTLEAKANLLRAQAAKVDAETTTKKIEAVFAATQSAQAIAAQPMIAPVADQVLKSAGFQDADAAPIVAAPNGEAIPPVPMRQNTSPQFPAKPVSPLVGAEAGIEGGGQ